MNWHCAAGMIWKNDPWQGGKAHENSQRGRRDCLAESAFPPSPCLLCRNNDDLAMLIDIFFILHTDV